MAGIAIVLDLFKKSHNKHTFHSQSSLSSAAAVSAFATAPFASRFLFGYVFCIEYWCSVSISIDWIMMDKMIGLLSRIVYEISVNLKPRFIFVLIELKQHSYPAVHCLVVSTYQWFKYLFYVIYSSFEPRVAYCDAAAPAAIDDDYLAAIRKMSADAFQFETPTYVPSSKVYNIQPKPLFSAFEFRALTMTTVRSLLMFYLPLLEPKPDDDFLNNDAEEGRKDLIVPLKKSVKQIAREVRILYSGSFSLFVCLYCDLNWWFRGLYIWFHRPQLWQLGESSKGWLLVMSHSVWHGNF